MKASSAGIGSLLAAVVFLIPFVLPEARASDLLDAAREELRAARVPEKEIRLRLRIIENVSTVKAYFPHADGGRPETRNSKYWKTNEDGTYVPRGRPVESVRDLWRTVSGIRCAKLSALVMIKAMIDEADEKRLAELDEMLDGKVIPNGLPHRGVGLLFTKPEPKHGGVFQIEELLPGDEVWFDNPYFDLLDRSVKRKYYGQEGHHVFYVGGGKVMDMYAREARSIGDFRKTFLRWKSVGIGSAASGRKPRAADFQIKAVRRVKL